MHSETGVFVKIDPTYVGLGFMGEQEFTQRRGKKQGLCRS